MRTSRVVVYTRSEESMELHDEDDGRVELDATVMKEEWCEINEANSEKCVACRD